jgi:hypothetical protein
MTPTNDTPTAAEALSRAFAIVKEPCSAAETQRAEVLLGIARELREEAQYRSIAGRRLALSGWSKEALAKLPGAPAVEAPPADPEATAVTIAVDPSIAKLAHERPTMVHEWAKGIVANALATGAPLDYGQRMQDDPGITQRIRTPWQVGDKAECKHCHTPIQLDEAETTGLKADNVKVWRHKYTGQAVCADAHMGPTEGGFQGHTFAEPSIE